MKRPSASPEDRPRGSARAYRETAHVVLFLLSSGYGVLAIHGNHAHRDPPVVFYNEKQNKNTNGIVIDLTVYCVVRPTGSMYGVGQIQEVRGDIVLELMNVLRN